MTIIRYYIMRLMNNIILVCFLTSVIPFSQADTFVSKLPTTVITTDYTEEMWVFLKQPVTDATLCIFYQEDFSSQEQPSKLEIASTDMTLTVVYTSYSESSSEDKPLSLTMNNVVRLKSWIHIALTEKLNSGNYELTLYVDGLASGPNTVSPTGTSTLTKVN